MLTFDGYTTWANLRKCKMNSGSLHVGGHVLAVRMPYPTLRDVVYLYYKENFKEKRHDLHLQKTALISKY